MTMPVVNPGEVWMIDFGMTAKVRPALLLTGTPADNELDIITVLHRKPLPRLSFRGQAFVVRVNHGG